MTPEEQAIQDIRDRLTRIEAAIDERLRPDVTAIRVDLTTLEVSLTDKYVTLVQYRPFEAALKYFIGLMCGSVIVAAIALVVGNR